MVLSVGLLAPAVRNRDEEVKASIKPCPQRISQRSIMSLQQTKKFHQLYGIFGCDLPHGPNVAHVHVHLCASMCMRRCVWH